MRECLDFLRPVDYHTVVQRCPMKFASVQELHSKTADVLAQAEKEDIIITVRGKPKAVIRRLQEDELEDYVLAHHPKFQQVLKEAWEDYRRHGGVDLDALLERSRRKLEAVHSSTRAPRPKRSRRS